MSLKVLKTGILDTIQDLGRFGYQHLGINPNGVMDRYAAQLGNILVGNELAHPVIELHFPASAFLFDKPSLIAITGADFRPAINGQPIPLNQPLIVNKDAHLQFGKKIRGERCYLAVKDLKISPWLNSCSTNLKASAGGYKGKKLEKNDLIEAEDDIDYTDRVSKNKFPLLPWKADSQLHEEKEEIFVIPGHEWDLLDGSNKEVFIRSEFKISRFADRMGYQMEGPAISFKNEELVSTGVGFGTIQLLPNGQLIILMADHQTTGGYPRLAHVISAHLPILAQMGPGKKLKFTVAGMEKAEDLLLQQHQHLLQLQNACKFRLAEFFG